MSKRSSVSHDTYGFVVKKKKVLAKETGSVETYLLTLSKSWSCNQGQECDQQLNNWTRAAASSHFQSTFLSAIEIELNIVVQGCHFFSHRLKFGSSKCNLFVRLIVIRSNQRLRGGGIVHGWSKVYVLPLIVVIVVVVVDLIISKASKPRATPSSFFLGYFLILALESGRQKSRASKISLQLHALTFVNDGPVFSVNN